MTQPDTLQNDQFLKRLQFMRSITEHRTIGNYSKAYETWKRMQNLFRCVLSSLKPTGGDRTTKILDLGCGDGFFPFYLYYNLPAAKVEIHGMDLTELEVQFARAFMAFARIPEQALQFSVGDATRTELESGSYDLVVCSEVLEHIPRPEECFQEIFRIVRKGGTAIISTPNARNPLRLAAGVVKRLMGRPPAAPEPEAEPGSPYPGHISVMTLKQMTDRARAAGFRVAAIRRSSLLLGGPKMNAHPILFSLYLLVDRLLDWLPFCKQCTENLTLVLKKDS